MIAYLFDIDGVLSDPQEKQVVEKELFTQIIKRLMRGDPVCFNTGRSTKWMVERVIVHLLEQAKDKTIFSNFFATGEKGGTWLHFDREGEMHHQIAKEFALPQELHDKIKQLVETDFRDVMFFDDTKETMISVEMHDGYDMKIFHERRETFVVAVKKLLADFNDAGYTVDPTTIATDIENPLVGKALGARRFLTFLEEKKIVPTEFYTFGDTPSDKEMADELHKRSKRVTFIFVGDKDTLGEVTNAYPIIFAGKYSQGTLSYLENELKGSGEDHN